MCSLNPPDENKRSSRMTGFGVIYLVFLDTHQIFLRDVGQEQALHNILKQPQCQQSRMKLYRLAQTQMFTLYLTQVLGDVTFPAADVQSERERPEERGRVSGV